MSGNEIKYKISAEDKVSDVLTKVRAGFADTRANITAVANGFRSGGWSGGVQALKGLQVNGLASSVMFKGLLGMVNPVGLALGGLALAGAAASAAIRGIVHATNEAVKFQSFTFQLRTLTGSMREARQVMLQLTEGKFSESEMFFGTDAVVEAYRALHTYSNGALASAYAVNVLGNHAAKMGKDVRQVAEVVGRAWQGIVSGEGLGRTGMQLFTELRIPRSVIRDLERMQEEGASAADIWDRLWSEISASSGTIDGLSGSVEMLGKRIADTKGTIATQLGEIFLPFRQAFDTVWLHILGRIDQITKNPIRLYVHAVLPENLSGLYDAVEAVYKKKTGRGFLSFLDFAPKELPDEEFLKLSKKQQDALIDKANVSGNAILAQRYQKAQLMGESEEARTAKVEEFLKTKDKADRAARLLQLPASKLEDMAALAGRKGNVAEYEELSALAVRKREQEAKEAAQEQERQTRDRNQSWNEIARLEDEAKASRERVELGGMSLEDRAAHFRYKAEDAEAEAARIRGGRADANLPLEDRRVIAELLAEAAKAREDETEARRAIDERKKSDSEARASSIANARQSNDARDEKMRYDRMSDGQKASYVADSLAQIAAALAGETDLLKRESLVARRMDFEERGADLASRRADLLEKAGKAREDLGRMALSPSISSVDMVGRFAWMQAIGRGQSPDEQIARNTEAMKELLGQIAKAQGVK